MGTVTNLNPTGDIGEFLDFLYGVEDGFVYLPTKDPDSGKWFQEWFKWPSNRKDAVNHVLLKSKTREVYMSPVIFTEAKVNASYVKGSSVVWSEFDGVLPSIDEIKEAHAPLPTVRVRSSNGGHEHWYWKLDKFSTDLKTLQDTNKSLAYSLGADPSCWDLEQVLRPVGSVNHKRDGKPVTLITNSYKFSNLDSFQDLPPVEEICNEADFDKQSIPSADTVLLKYAWQPSEIELIRSRALEGQRSSMLTKLGYICCEKGMDNGEVYAVLAYADSRWGKFSERANKKQCYIRLIDYVRQKYPYRSESTETESTTDPLEYPTHRYRTMGFMSHYRNTDRVEWIIEGLLHDTAIMYFVGKAGSLKTAFAMELGMNLAMQKTILNWKVNVDRPLKILMWSLEMSGPELVVRQDKVVERSSEEEQLQLEDNFIIYSDPESVRLFDQGDAEKFKNTIIEEKVDGIIIDSASIAFATNMSEEEVVKKAVIFLQRLRHKHKFFAIIIHHPRKDPAGVKSQRMSLSDLFGSQALENSATTVIGMALREKKTEDEPQRIAFMHLKTRFAEVPADYDIELNKEDFTFKRPVITLGTPSPSDMDMAKMASNLSPSRKPKRGDANGPGITF